MAFEDFVTDLNQQALDGLIDPVIGREDELIDITECLARRKKNNVIVVGEPCWIKLLLQKDLH